MNQIKNYYAVPVLAGTDPADCYGEGDFHYNGVRGLGQVAAPINPSNFFTDAQGKPEWLKIGLVVGALGVAYAAWMR